MVRESVFEEIHRAEWARLVAALTRRFGSLDLAEESAAEAFAAAVTHWRDGLPPNPGGWLMTTASRRALDRLRREKVGAEKYATFGAELAGAVGHGAISPGADAHLDDEPAAVEDDRLSLFFTCCHPALAREAQVALTLRMLGGLSVADIARALLSSEAAVGQRITRAKAKIAATGIPYRMPSVEDLPLRIDAVLTVLYLVFNEGYLPGGSDAVVRVDLCAEAMRLARLVVGLMPGDGEAVGLLALMLMTEARRPARVSAEGSLVLLADQDRSLWDRRLIAEGHQLVRARIASGSAPGRFQLQAAINAVHTFAPDLASTDWSQLSTLYEQLATVDPSPVVALNRAVVTAELDGPAVALAEVDRLELADYHAWHAVRGELLARLGRGPEAAAALERARELAANPAEQRLLERRREDLRGPGG